MGDISEMMLEGILCSGCGVFLENEEGEAPGFPMLCESCSIEFVMKEVTKKAAKWES